MNIKKIISVILSAGIGISLLCGCSDKNNVPTETTITSLISESDTAAAALDAIEETTDISPTDSEENSETALEDTETEQYIETAMIYTDDVSDESESGDMTDTEQSELIVKDGSYTTPEDVAEYIHNFGTLPSNFIRKKEAQKLGWVSSEGNLWDVAPGKSIGGDRFGNYEGILPDGNYTECDVNFDGGYRGKERIIFSEDGRIYYTNDHYETFTQLY